MAERKPHAVTTQRADRQATVHFMTEAIDRELEEILKHMLAIEAASRRIRALVDSAAPWVQQAPKSSLYGRVQDV